MNNQQKREGLSRAISRICEIIAACLRYQHWHADPETSDLHGYDDKTAQDLCDVVEVEILALRIRITELETKRVLLDFYEDETLRQTNISELSAEKQGYIEQRKQIACA